MGLKKLSLAAVGLMLVTPSYSAVNLSSEQDKLSYAIGADFGKNFKNQGIEINAQAFSQGLTDALSGNALQMSEEQRKQVIQTFQQKIMAKQKVVMAEKIKKLKQQATENQKKGKAFLAENSKKPGVVVLPSGLQYKVLTKGKGPKPTKEDTVTVDYSGRLINGTVFDSSEKAGKPATFKLNQVIKGWSEAVQLMQEGATWEIYVPADLAYGQRGVGGPIGPNETLIFKIHLISIKK